MSYTINVDIEVHEVDVPLTPEEALRAARIHFGQSYDQKPSQDIKIIRGHGENNEEFVVSVNTALIKISQGIDPGAPLT